MATTEAAPKRRLFNLANALTLFRFVAAPFMVYFILAMPPESDAPPGAGGTWRLSAAPFGLLILTLFSDLFDGLVARRYRVVTNFGKIMDPVADSTFFMTVLFAFSASDRFHDHFPIWLPLIVLYREIAIQVLRRYGALKGMVLAARWSGKAKMAVQSVLLAVWFALLALCDLDFAMGERAAAGGSPVFVCNWLDARIGPHLGALLFGAGVAIAIVNVLSLLEYLRDVPKLVDEWNE